MNLINRISLAATLILYVLFGLSYSQKQGFWHDEIYTLTFLKGMSIYSFEGSIWSEKDSIYDVAHFKNLFAKDNFYDNFSTQIQHEGHPPLYFILLKFWSYIFGSSEVGLRSFSLFCGILAFLILFNLFKRKSKNNYSAWGVLVILISNPFLFYFNNEARMYALAFLLSILSFSYWLNYQNDKKIKSYSFFCFFLSSVALLYTHYYGLFFLSSLALLELFIYGFKRSIFNHGIALICFLPWSLMIKKQLIFHDVHWTDGIISFSQSTLGYFKGIIHLLISPMSEPLSHEWIILLVIFSIMILFLFLKEWKFTLVLLSTIIFYGLQLYIFDQLEGHHSILVPRYYIFSLIFVFWGIHKMIDRANRLSSLLIPLTYSFLATNVLFQLYTLDRAPKQMLREVAGFVDNQIDSKSTILVFEPQGPLLIGVAYYLHNNFKLISAHKIHAKSISSAVYIDEMLGLPTLEHKYHYKEQKKLELIPFVGVFLYK